MSVTASGEIISVVNNYVFYTFLAGSTNTITFPSNTTAQVLIVGGGGGGGDGATAANNSGQGGGGGGGVGVGSLNFTANTIYTIKVAGSTGGNGGTSFIEGGGISEIANGGGKGADSSTTTKNGGSGGGGSIVNNGVTGGSSTRGTGTLTYYGNAGGDADVSGGGGGGGAGGPGAKASGNNGGNGGIGYTWHMNGISYGGGGGGGASDTSGTFGTGVDGGGNGASSAAGTDGIANRGGGGGGGISLTSGTSRVGKDGGSGIVIIAVLNTTITNGSFDMNTTDIPTNSHFYVSNSIDSRLFAGNQTFPGIGIYFPCWNFYARDASTNAIILANGNGGDFGVYNNPATKCLIIQQTAGSSLYSSYLTISQDVVFLKGTYLLTYSAAPRNTGYIPGQVLSASISSSTFGTTILKSPQFLPAGVWTTFNSSFYIFTPGVYTIIFAVEANSESTQYDSSIFLTGISLTTTSQVPCFLEGSKILYLNPTTNFEEYVPIENLRKGDLIKTYSSGYKELAHIGQTKLFLPRMISDKTDSLYRLCKSKIRELKEDLCITGRHCILHSKISDDLREQIVKHMGDVFVTENHYRVPAWLDDRSEQYNNTADETVTVWHIALANENIYHNYGVWANGLLVETCSILYLTKISDMELIH